MNYKKTTLSVVTIATLTTLNAYEMRPVGFKAIGMGGAGVASSRGSLATYYNPALIGVSDYTAEISFNAGVGIRENKLADTVDKLNSLDLSNTVDRIAAHAPTNGTNSDADKANIKNAQNVLNLIPNGNGLQLTPNISLTGQFSQYFAIGAYASSEVRAKMVIDKNRLNLIVQDPNNNNAYYSYDPVNDTYSNSSAASYIAGSLQYALEGNTSIDGDASTYLNVSSLNIAEIPVSFAYPIEQKNGIMSFGISVKPMSVETFSTQLAIDSASKDIENEYDKNKKTYSSLGLDLGFAYKEEQTGLTLALVGKNVNSPEFKTQADANGNVETFKLDAFYRAGMSLPVWNDNIELAVDADLQESDTSYDNMKAQYVGGGMEFHPASWFAARLGARKNISSRSIDEGTIYTAGMGFGLKWFQFDVSAEMSSKTGNYDGNDIPKYASVNFSLISRWGDGYNQKQPPVDNSIRPVEDTNSTISDEEKNRIQEESNKAHTELNADVAKQFGL